MALSVGDRAVRSLTADEVMAMVEAGILPEDEPVELLHGVLTEKSVKTPAHEAVKVRLVQWLAPNADAGGYQVRVESPMVVPDRTSLPEPDFAVVTRTDAIDHPTTALLVVEVAVSSLRTDLTIKPALFSAAGVPELWVVDVPARRLRIFAEPRSNAYSHRAVRDSEGCARPRHVQVEPLDLAGLFQGL